MKLIILVAAGGAIGSVLRYLVYKFLVGSSLAQGIPVLPWATIVVNVIGSFLIGYMIVFWVGKLSGSPEFRAFWITGILGGFTTFSAFSYDAYEIYINQNLTLATIYVFGCVILSIAALLLGIALFEWLHT